MNQHIESVKDYYSKTLKTNQDLKTTACCSAESIPGYLKKLVSEIHPDVRAKFYGCGVPVPFALEDKTILDLGSGSGRDCFLFSKLVGENGRVIGIDMTPEQISVALEHTDYHIEKFGYKKSNITFKEGYMEDLASLDIADNSIDVVVSNCVFNLSPDKERLYREVFRVLKPGGELYFSDVFTNRRLSAKAQSNPVLLGECLGGAMYTEDFRRLMAKLGCNDYRQMGAVKIEITNDEVQSQCEGAEFYSITVRAFKMELEDRCEDYGQVAYYKGGIPFSENGFILDDHHIFEKDKPMLVCSNTANMLSQSRFAPYFRIEGGLSKHYGLFDCSDNNTASTAATPGACC